MLLCRALVTAIAISYLICVLWLSGMQKEDLDVNMLRKLQRHNVNIDDMNSETFRQDCLQFFKSKNAKKPSPSLGREKNETTIKETSSQINVKHNLKSIEKIMAAMINKQIPNKDNKTNKVADVSTLELMKEDNTKEIQDKPTNNEFTLSPETFGRDTQAKKHDGHHSKLDEIMQFWQMFNTTLSSEKKYELTTKSPSFYQIAGNESEFMNKLLANYIRNNQELTTEKPITTLPVDFHKLSQQIDKLLELLPQNEKLKKGDTYEMRNESKTIQAKDMIPSEYHFINIPQKSSLQTMRLKQYYNAMPIIDTYKSKKESSIIDQNHGIINLASNDNIKKKDVLSHMNSIKNESHATNAPITKTTTDNNITEKEVTKTISKDVIKEIAENIKALVLKDLRQEITPVTPIPMTTSAKLRTTPNLSTITTVAPTPAPKRENAIPNNTQDATKVMENFLKLFEQFKAIKEEPVMAGKMDIKISGTTLVKPRYRNPLNVDSPAPILVVGSKVKNRPDNRPISYSSFKGMKSEIIPTLPINTATVIKVNPIMYTHLNQNMMKKEPKMLQTNSGEIPPLGIPISNPFKLIHQNIVITTKPSLNKYKKQNDRWGNTYKHDSSFIDVTRTSEEKMYKPHSTPAKQINFDQSIQTKQNSHTSKRVQILGEGKGPSRFEVVNPNSSEQRSYRNAKLENLEDEEIPKRSVPPHKTVEKYKEEHKRHPRFEKEKRKRIYDDETVTKMSTQDDITEVSMQFGNEKSKSSEKGYYENDRITNREDGNRPPPFGNERSKSSEYRFYKSTKFPSQFESQNLKSTEKNLYKIDKPRYEDDDRRLSLYKDHETRSSEKSFYNIKIPNHMEERPRPSKLEEDKLKPLDYEIKNVRAKDLETGHRLPRYKDYKDNYENPINVNDSRHLSQIENDKQKSLEQNTYKLGKLVKEDDSRLLQFENNKRKPLEQFTKKEKLGYPEDGHNQWRYEDDKVKELDLSPNNIEKSRNPEENQRLYQYNDDKIKPVQHISNKISQDGNHHASLFKDDNQKQIKQFTLHERLGNLESDPLLPRHENGKLKPMDHHSYKIEKPEYKENSQHHSRFEDKTLKPLEYFVKNERARNQEDYQGISRYEGNKLEPLESTPQKNVPYINKEDRQRPPRFEEYQTKAFEHGPYKTEKLWSRVEDHLPSRFEEDKHKLLEQITKMESLKNQEDSYRLPRYEDDKLKSLEQRPYKTEKYRNQEDDHRLSRLESVRISDHISNKKNSINEDKYGLSRVDEDRPKAFDQISHTRIWNQDDRQVDKLKLLEKSPYKSDRHGNQKELLFKEDKLNFLEQIPHERKITSNEQGSYRLSRVEDGKPKPLEQIQYPRINYEKDSLIVPHFESEKIKPLEHRLFEHGSIKKERPIQYEDILNSRLMGKPKIYEVRDKYGDKISYGSYKNGDRERFHEILERVDDMREDRDNMNAKKPLSLTSRQQQPINDLKKAPRYDDTHFNNFLKTQQKVNDMLEKILATKANHDDPLSVETT